jgi:hypothetical protein
MLTAPRPAPWAQCSHDADTSARVRHQILVDMNLVDINAATAGGGARLLADGKQVPVSGGSW